MEAREFSARGRQVTPHDGMIFRSNCPKVAVYDPSGSGGITHYTFELAEGLAKNGCRVTLITSEDYELAGLTRSFDLWFLFKKSWVKSGISRISALWNGRRVAVGAESSVPEAFRATGDPGRPGWMKRELNSLRFTCVLFKTVLLLALNGTTVVHFQWLKDRRADLRFMQLLRFLGFKIVYTVHDVLPHDQYTVENRTFYQRVYRYPHKLIVHCESNRKELLELFTVDPEKICVIPHGCQSACFDTSSTTTTAARRRLGIPDDRRVVLFFGLIKRYKGLEYLLEAFQTIETRCDKALLLIAGKIAPWDGDSHRHHVALLAPYAAWGNIHIRDEYIPQDQAADYFAAADLVVLPYTKASQSGVLLMACAAGKAVVVTDTGGLPEVVQDGRTGFVVPPKDAKAIADASVRILSDPDLGRRFGAQARLLADTVYSWQAIGATTLRLYQSLMPAEAVRRKESSHLFEGFDADEADH